MRYKLPIFTAVILSGCASYSIRQNEPSLGEELSTNLLNVHKMYCSGTSESNTRLAKLKSENRPYLVVDKKTGEKSNVWILVPPKFEKIGIETLTQWGFSVRELLTGGSCGVAYLHPEELEAYKAGILP